jgi:ubiquinone/menaquinone biosynthesis C-methylase UbiE
MRHTLLTEFMIQAPYQPATNYWRAVEVEEVIKRGLPEGRGLDLGCGDGHLMAIILANTGARELTGVDIDRSETVLAQKRNIYTDVVTAPGDCLPFPDSHFDFVFSNSVLEHIQNILDVLKEVRRVLKPKGHFVFTVPGPDFHACLKGPRTPEMREQYLRETDARCFHLRYWGQQEWWENLRAAGLQPVHQHGYLTKPEVQRWEFLASMTSVILYRLTGRRKQPIEIQRRIGIRSSKTRFPRALASLSARILDFGSPSGNSPCGCLLIEATK